MPNGLYGDVIPGRHLIAPVPLVQAAAGGDTGILRVEGKQNQLVKGAALNLGHHLFGQWMPVAHGHEDTRGQGFLQLLLQGGGLALRQLDDGGTPTDLGVALPHFGGAIARHQTRQGAARQPGQREVNDVGIGEQVVEEGLHGVEGVGAAELKQHHADSLAASMLVGWRRLVGHQTGAEPRARVDSRAAMTASVNSLVEVVPPRSHVRWRPF